MLDLIFPKICYVCQKEGEYICTNCFKKLIDVNPLNMCHICNKECRVGFMHSECKEYSYIDGVLNLSVYDGLIKKMIYDIKYNYFYSLTQSMGKIMADYLLFYSFKPNNTLITYVPSSKKKIRLRGFNQSHLLAKEVSKFSQIPVVSILAKTHNTGAQAKLHKFERAENLKGAFELIQKVSLNQELKNILIVDDVFTTGATLNECAKVIKSKYSTSNVFGFVIAKARS